MRDLDIPLVAHEQVTGTGQGLVMTTEGSQLWGREDGEETWMSR